MADTEFKIRPDGSDLGVAMAQLDRKLGAMARGEANPKQLYRELEAQHAALVQGNAWPGASSVKGHVQVPVVFRRTVGGFLVKMKWDYLPDVGGPTVLAVCPNCYYDAPTQVNTKKATRPIALDNQIARLMGDPEADKKLVPFRMSYPAFHVYLEGNRLTVTETIRCPNHYRCSFIVRLNEGVAERVSGRIVKSTEKRVAGPLVRVK